MRKLKGSLQKKTISGREYAYDAYSPCLHLFCGMSDIGGVRVDINPKSKATHIMDIFEFLKENTDRFESVVFDPPYSKRAADNYLKLHNQPITAYWYSILDPMTEKTQFLHDTIQKMSPRFIITKCWTIPPFHQRGYVIKDGLFGYSGSLRPVTVLTVFERGGRRLDTYLNDYEQET